MAAKRAIRKKAKPVIGWRETLSLPDLGVPAIQAKIDTGAKTSAIHAFRIKEVEVEGELFVEFFIHPKKRKAKPEIKARARVLDQRWVRSSNGKRERRYVIETTAQLGENEFPLEVTLTNRDEMGFRMLLGRQALRRRFAIDPGASYLLSHKPK